MASETIQGSVTPRWNTAQPSYAAPLRSIAATGAGISRFGVGSVRGDGDDGMLIGGYTFHEKEPADVVALLDAASALLTDAPR